jgi:hypothetical protein
MSEAVIGLVGVVIGGLLTGGVNFLLEHRREKRSGQAASRLVHAALTSTTTFVEASLVERMWMGDPREGLADDVWVEHRNAIAEAPAFDGWYPVSLAWSFITQLRRLTELFDEGPGDDPMQERDEEFFRLGLLMLRIADTALLDYAKTESYDTNSKGEADPEAETEPPEDDGEGWRLAPDDPIEQVLEAAKKTEPRKKRSRRR